MRATYTFGTGDVRVVDAMSIEKEML